MADENSLRVISEKSNQLLERQISAFQVKQERAISILVLVSIFFSIFFNVVEKSTEFTKIFFTVPLIIFFWGATLVYHAIKYQKLNHGYNPDKFSEFINFETNEILLFEISTNQLAFRENTEILEKQTNNFNKGIQRLAISIGISMSLLYFEMELKTLNFFNNGSRKSTIRTDSTSIEHPFDTTRKYYSKTFVDSSNCK